MVISLNILFVSAVIAIISTLPYFYPENIFTTTSARLQTANDVLFTRLAFARGGLGELTESDNLLKPKLASLDARLLYFTYGPDVVTNCPFCISDEPLSYFYYALPSILLPHVLHVLALGLATSSSIGDKYGNRWRTFAAVLGTATVAVECYIWTAYDWKANARAVVPEQYVHFYWRMRVYRGINMALIDFLVASILCLSSTNRFFVLPITSAERMETAMRMLETARGKMNALGVLRNVTARDEALRRKAEIYWQREGQLMREVMDEREVVEGVRNALGERVQVAKVEEDARRYAEGVTNWPALQNGYPT